MLQKHKGKGMKKIAFFCIIFIFIISCSGKKAMVKADEDGITMIGGKKALLQVLHYPEEALEKGIEGVVTLQAYIDTGGTVRSCKILSGNEYLNDAAVRALKQQRFEPYVVNGQKSPVQVIFPIHFALSKDIDIKAYEKSSLIASAQSLYEMPVETLGDHISKRSPGGIREYYSESAHWWPQEDPEAPWTYRDSVNPSAFRKHAEILSESGKIISGLVAANIVKHDKAYTERALEHIRAWFTNPETSMLPHFRYAGAIPKRSEGRMSGIYEALPLAEIILALPYLEAFLSPGEQTLLRDWLSDFAEYLNKYALDQKNPDTGSSSAFLLYLLIADFLQDEKAIQEAGTYFSGVMLPQCLSEDSFLFDPAKNLKFDYDIFIHAELISAAAQIFLKNGLNYRKLQSDEHYPMEYLAEYISQKLWNGTLRPTENYRGRYMFLLFEGKYRGNPEYLELWKSLEDLHGKTLDFPLRQPLLWKLP